jgi:hypothetical protein
MSPGVYGITVKDGVILLTGWKVDSFSLPVGIIGGWARALEDHISDHDAIMILGGQLRFFPPSLCEADGSSVKDLL